MTAPVLRWGSEALWQQLEPLLPGLSVEVVHSIPSTNTALLDRAHVVADSQLDDGNVMVRRSVESGAFGRRGVDVQPCLLVAERQTAGRGRQGRPWKSALGESLTFSLSLPLAITDWSGLSLAVGVALTEAIGCTTGSEIDARRVGLKWPNDIWLMNGDEGRKLGGVLIETVAAGARRLVVIGVGLNVLPFPAGDLSTGFACVQEFDPGITAPALLARVAPPLVRAIREFERDGFAAFADRFAALDVLRGRAVYTTRSDAAAGIAQGVSPQGGLLLLTADGLKTVLSGEVSIRLNPESGSGATVPW